MSNQCSPQVIAKARAWKFSIALSNEQIKRLENEFVAAIEQERKERDEREDVLRRRIHFSEKHNQMFERCESGWCNPSDWVRPGDDPVAETRALATRRIAELEAEPEAGA